MSGHRLVQIIQLHSRLSHDCAVSAVLLFVHLLNLFLPLHLLCPRDQACASVHASTIAHGWIVTHCLVLAHVLFMEKKAQFDKLQCKVMMRSVPRPEETAKMRDPKVLQEFLRQP